jgi:hypothetical protein
MTAVAKLTSAVAPSFEVAASGRLVGGWGRVAVARVPSWRLGFWEGGREVLGIMNDWID